jgi:hypothetical protein
MTRYPDDFDSVVASATVPKSASFENDQAYALELIEMQVLRRAETLWDGEVYTDDEYARRFSAKPSEVAARTFAKEIAYTMFEALAIKVLPWRSIKRMNLGGCRQVARSDEEARSDLDRIASARYPAKHVKARMREAIEALAQHGRDVSMMVEHDGGLIWPMTSLRSDAMGAEQRALAFAEVPDAVALVAWLHKDALIKRLDAEIDTESDDPASLSHEAREKAEAEVMGIDRHRTAGGGASVRCVGTRSCLRASCRNQPTRPAWSTARDRIAR